MVKTFVVSLKNETLRRKHISEQCKKYGLDTEIVDTVDMRGIKEDKLKLKAQLNLSGFSLINFNSF